MAIAMRRDLQWHVFTSRWLILGDPPPITESLIRSTGNTENVERSQCALLHFADGMIRSETGRAKRAPGRGRAFALAREIRRVQHTNASLAAEDLADDFPFDATIVNRNAHDSRRPPRDRDLRTAGFPRSPISPELPSGFLRIFGIGRGADGYDVSAHLFANTAGGYGNY